MPSNNEQRIFVVTDNNAVINSENLFESKDEVLGVNSVYRKRYSEPYKSNEFSRSSRADSNENPKDEFGLFVVSVTGGKPDRNAKLFFNLLNERAGGIFLHNPKTGEITLKVRASSGSVLSNSKSSQALAKLIDENCGQNAKQRILLRVGRLLKRIAHDDYFSGKVDYADFEAINDASIQATFIYHFIHERVNTINYEKVKGEATNQNFIDNYHNPALIAEVEVLIEMGENATFPKRHEFPILSNHLLIHYHFSWGKVEVEYDHYSDSKIRNYRITRK